MTAVGIDVGKRSLDMAIDGHTKVVRFPNTHAGITKLIGHLASVDDPHIAVEATGGYEQPLMDAEVTGTRPNGPSVRVDRFVRPSGR